MVNSSEREAWEKFSVGPGQCPQWKIETRSLSNCKGCNVLVATLFSRVKLPWPSFCGNVLYDLDDLCTYYCFFPIAFSHRSPNHPWLLLAFPQFSLYNDILNFVLGLLSAGGGTSRLVKAFQTLARLDSNNSLSESSVVETMHHGCLMRHHPAGRLIS